MSLSGSTGLKSFVNGTFVGTAERLNGKTVYAKEGDEGIWLYFATDGSWWVSNTVSKEGNKAAGFAYTEVGLAHPGAAKNWRVTIGGKFEPQPVLSSVMVSRQHPFSIHYP